MLFQNSFQNMWPAWKCCFKKDFTPLGHLGSETYKKDGVTSHPFSKGPISEKFNQKDIANCSPLYVMNLSLDTQISKSLSQYASKQLTYPNLSTNTYCAVAFNRNSLR